MKVTLDQTSAAISLRTSSLINLGIKTRKPFLPTIFPQTEMATQSQPLKELQVYVAKTTDTDYGLSHADEDEQYAARLGKTLYSLQNQVKQHEAALERVSP